MSMREITVGAWILCVTGTDNEPKISDVELARSLGYVSVHEVRKRILRYIKEGILKDIEIIATVAENGRGRPGKMYMLTEEQALFVAARCETELANEILKEMIHVFALARRGMLPAQNQSMDFAQMTSVISKAVAEGVATGNAALHQEFAKSNAILLDGMQQMMNRNLQEHVEATHITQQVIGSGGSWHIRERIKTIAEIRFPDDAKMQKAERSAMQLNLRSAVQFFGTGRSWNHLPQDKWQQALNWLEEQYRSAARGAKAAGREPAPDKRTAMQLAFGWGEPSIPKGN